MSYNYLQCARQCANYDRTRFMSTLSQSVNLLQCGLKMAKNQVCTTIHGPTGYEVTKKLDLREKTCLITGATSGIGLEITRCLSARGCTMLMASRNKYAAGIVGKHVSSEDIQRLRFYETNLASLRSVKKCSSEILRNEKKIDIVILNAAVFGIPWTLTEDLLETTFQVNYLSQLYLLMNIDSILAANARIVFMSSESHRNVNWSLRDQMIPTEDMISLPRNKYTSIKAYNISKLCGLLGMHYLGYRWMRTSKGLFAAHPGSFIKTQLCNNWWPYEMLYTIMIPFSKTISQAASTPLYCATSPDLEGVSAAYYKDCKRCEDSELAQDFHLAFRINDLSRELLSERRELLASDDEKVEERGENSPQQAKDSVHETLTPDYS